MRSGDNMAVSIICSRSRASFHAKPPDFWGYFYRCGTAEASLNGTARWCGAAIARAVDDQNHPLDILVGPRLASPSALVSARAKLAFSAGLKKRAITSRRPWETRN